MASFSCLVTANRSASILLVKEGGKNVETLKRINKNFFKYEK
jgi:hypothetical protein